MQEEKQKQEGSKTRRERWGFLRLKKQHFEAGKKMEGRWNMNFPFQFQGSALHKDGDASKTGTNKTRTRTNRT